MNKCKWSQNSFCQVMVFKNTTTKVGCDGLHAACNPKRNLDLVDTRNRSGPKRPGWGGRRAGAGAPRANLNRLLHGRDSKLLKVAVEKLAADPELRAFLLLLARAATEGALPQTTKQLITRALGTPEREAAAVTLKRMRQGVSHVS